MKKFLLTLMCLLSLATAANAAVTSPYSFSVSKTTWSAPGAQTLEGVEWNLQVTWNDATKTYFNYDATKGQQVGSSNNYAKSFTLSTSAIPGTIKSVKVNTSAASKATANVAVTVNGTEFKCNGSSTATTSATADDYTFTGEAAGEIVISWTDLTASKAQYFKSVEVVFETGDNNDDNNDTPATSTVTLAGNFTNGQWAESTNTANAVDNVATFVVENWAAVNEFQFVYDGTWYGKTDADLANGVEVQAGTGYKNNFTIAGAEGKTVTLTFNIDTKKAKATWEAEAPALGNVDVLTIAGLAPFTEKGSFTSGTYADFTDATFVSAAKYTGNITKNSTNDIQIRNTKNSGIITTVSGGKAKKVTLTWGTGISTNYSRGIDVYGSHEPYSASGDVLDTNKRGTALGTIDYNKGENPQTELTIDGDWEYLGFSVMGGTCYLVDLSIEWEAPEAEQVVTYALHGQFSGDAEKWDDVDLVEAVSGWYKAENVVVEAIDGATPQFGVKVLTDGNQSGWYASTAADVTVANNESYDLTNTNANNFFIEPGKYSISFNPTTSKLYVVKTGEGGGEEPVTDVNYIYTLYSSDLSPLAESAALVEEEWTEYFEEDYTLVQDGVATFVVAEWPENAQFFLDRGDALNYEAATVELGSGAELGNGVVTTLNSADPEDYESVLMSLPASANGQEVTFSYVIADNTLTATWEASSEQGGEQGGTTVTTSTVTFDFTKEGAYGMTTQSGNSQDYNPEEVEFKEGNVTMTLNGKTRLWSNTSGVVLRFHKDSYFTLSVPAGTEIIEVSADCTANDWQLEDATTTGIAFSDGTAQSLKFATNISRGNTAVKSITVKTQTESGIENVAADANAPVVYYNLQGVRVANPTAGVYVRVQGTKASKVLVK